MRHHLILLARKIFYLFNILYYVFFILFYSKSTNRTLSKSVKIRRARWYSHACDAAEVGRKKKMIETKNNFEHRVNPD